MIVLSLFALIALLAISVLHILWAAKIWWPVRDEKLLARSVAGFPGIDKMPPPAACLFVAVSLLIVGALLGAWTVHTVISALPGLSGPDLPIADPAGDTFWAPGAAWVVASGPR